MDQSAERPQQDKQQQPSPSSPQKPVDPVIRRGTGISREDAERGTAVPGEKAHAVPAALISGQV